MVPDAQISWIVDDLTVAGSVEEMGKVARFIKESGPQYGLIMAPKPAPCSCARCAGGSEVGFEDEVDAGVCQGKRKIKNWIYLPEKGQRENEDKLKIFQELMADWDCAEFLEDWECSTEGLERLLGAPLGKKEFCAKKAEKIVKDLLKGLSNLKELDMAQLEFFILKHTDCMKVTHLTRLLPPSVLDGALKMFDQKIRAELDRIQNGEKMSDEAWEQAKQPVRTVGMGLQDIRLTAGGNYASAQGAVAGARNRIFVQMVEWGQSNELRSSFWLTGN